jgi:cobalt/nickel transport system permease protein
MLIEQAAYASRWRHVSPAAKGLLALAGLIAAFAAPTAGGALAVAAALLAIACLGAGVGLGVYLRVAVPALLFLALGSISLAVSLGHDATSGALTLVVAPDAISQLARVSSRSLGALATLLLLVLTTPLADLIMLLRRLKTPELLLDLMVLCYRMLFVFSAAVHDTLTAQAARLGYATPRLALRSLGSLSANLAVQVWQRAQALHTAALARNNDGPLCFLAPPFANARRDTALALVAGGALIMLGQLP